MHGTVNLLNLGAKFVYASDLDKSFKKSAEKLLNAKSEYADRWKLDIGSALNLEYDDNFFDFVLCQNVIPHTSNELQALEEIYRVLKPGKKAYINVTGKGGLIARFYKELFRDEYKQNLLRNIVDNDLSEKWFQDQIDILMDKLEDDTIFIHSFKNVFTFFKTFNK